MYRRFLLFVSVCSVPAITSAHEVYVLPTHTIDDALATPAFSQWDIIVTNIDQFLLWAFLSSLIVFVVFFASISRKLERNFDPLLATLPPYAPFVGRVAIGLSFLAAAYYGALFGPELQLTAIFGDFAEIARVGLVLLGLMITCGVYVRIAATGALMYFICAVNAFGVYMLTYANYLGEILVLLILGAHILAFHPKGRDKLRMPRWFIRLKIRTSPYMFPFLRITFGISLLYSSLYAKIIHNQLALQVAYAYPGLVDFFGFEPHFLVLGAGLVELLLATLFIVGIEIRFASLFLLFWLSLSLAYFGEAVWPHLILIGIPISFICYGYDRYYLEGRLFKKGGREPVL